jgi:hypothetical protein
MKSLALMEILSLIEDYKNTYVLYKTNIFNIQIIELQTIFLIEKFHLSY